MRRDSGLCGSPARGFRIYISLAVETRGTRRASWVRTLSRIPHFRRNPQTLVQSTCSPLYPVTVRPAVSGISERSLAILAVFKELWHVGSVTLGNSTSMPPMRRSAGSVLRSAAARSGVLAPQSLNPAAPWLRRVPITQLGAPAFPPLLRQWGPT